jgi:hypothetical protein
MALHLAAERGHIEVVRQLLDHMDLEDVVELRQRRRNGPAQGGQRRPSRRRRTAALELPGRRGRRDCQRRGQDGSRLSRSIQAPLCRFLDRGTASWRRSIKHFPKRYLSFFVREGATTTLALVNDLPISGLGPRSKTSATSCLHVLSAEWVKAAFRILSRSPSRLEKLVVSSVLSMREEARSPEWKQRLASKNPKKHLFAWSNLFRRPHSNARTCTMRRGNWRLSQNRRWLMALRSAIIFVLVSTTNEISSLAKPVMPFGRI